MKKMKKLVMFLLLTGILCGLCGCKEETYEKEILIRSFDADEYADVDFTLENDDLLFQMDPTTTIFTVTQKSTGKVWYSSPADAANDAMADAASKRQLQSSIVLEYTTVNDLATILNTFEHSVTNGFYTLEKNEDSVKVNYSIGKIAKTFYIPLAVPEARMLEFYDQMDKAGKKQIDNRYRKIDINNLLPNDNKSDLLEKYPDLETTCVYEIREATKDHQKEKLQELFASYGYTEEDYEADLEIYGNSGDSEKPVYNVSIIYRLDGDRLEVEVPMDEIEYKEGYPITELRVLPFFGAGSATDTGYILVPEGSGAIINFNNGKTNFSEYYAQVYGWDYGMKRDVVVNETRAAYPVYGIANGESAFITTIDKYSTISTIHADIAGKKHGYNFAYASYELVHGSAMDISAKNENSVIAYEKNMPEGSLVQSYHFIDSNKYTDMAKEYREILLAKYPTLQRTSDSETPVAIEFIGAVDRQKQVLGIPVTMPEVMTDFEAAQEMIKDIVGAGYSNVSVRYSGWMNGGIDHSMPKDIDITSGMGGKKGLEALIRVAESLNVDLYLNGRVQNVYDSGITDGFFKSRDVAKYISREEVEIPVYSNIWFSGLADTRMEPHYLLRPSVCIDLMDSMFEFAEKYGAGVSYEEIGNLLSGDYNVKRPTIREKVMNMQTEKLAEIKAAGMPIAVTSGNEYVLPYATLITDLNLVGKEYLIFDATVPFYQLAIHGLVDYTGSAVNLAGDPMDTILKCAETGAGLAFTFYDEGADVLQGTEYMDFFGANYEGWKEKARTFYLRYREEMEGLNNLYMVDHQVLSEGVTATVYEDNTIVYVNQTLTDYEDGSVFVPARDYVVERSGN